VPSPDRQSTPPAKKSPVGTKGYTGNPGGRPKALREIEAMLNREHRNVANMKLVFDTIRMLALRGEKGDSGYAKLYLERVLGPVKDIDIDLTDAPPEVIEFLKNLQN
jgi:hypothetical protein